MDLTVPRAIRALSATAIVMLMRTAKALLSVIREMQVTLCRAVVEAKTTILVSISSKGESVYM